MDTTPQPSPPSTDLTRALAGWHVNLVKESYDMRHWNSGAFLAVAFLCVALLLLYAGIGPAILAWLLLAFGVFGAVNLVRVSRDPTLFQLRIVADDRAISIHLPGKKDTHVIPLDRLDKIVGIAHEWGLADGGDVVDFELHWEGKRLRISENFALESGLLFYFRQLPLFDSNVYWEASNAALRSQVPFWGKRYVLLQRP